MSSILKVMQSELICLEFIPLSIDSLFTSACSHLSLACPLNRAFMISSFPCLERPLSNNLINWPVLGTKICIFRSLGVSYFDPPVDPTKVVED